jgi:hypothetical protein
MKSKLLFVQLNRSDLLNVAALSNVLSYSNAARFGAVDKLGGNWSYRDSKYFSNAKLEFFI